MRSSNNYVQECDSDGLYAEKQCDDFSGFCTCVDRKTGKNLPNTDFASLPELLNCEAVKSKPSAKEPISLENRSSEQPNGPCSRKLLRFQSKPDRFSKSDYPECDETGFYRPMQCGRNGCWCVNKQGHKIEGSLSTVVEVKSDSDCLTQRSTGGFGVNKQNENPVTPPNRGNIFGIPVTEEEKVTESEKITESENRNEEPGFLSLLRPARIPDFNNKNEDNKISQRNKNGVTSNGGLCWQTGGICVDKKIGDVDDAVCRGVNVDMESADGYKCYSRNQVCCVVSKIDDESEILPWARVFSLAGSDEDENIGGGEDVEVAGSDEDGVNNDDDESGGNLENDEAEPVENLNSSQHHICGHGDLKIRCLQKGSSCRKSANMFFRDESILETGEFDNTENSVVDCAEKCREHEACESFTYYHEIDNAKYACVLRRKIEEIDAVYTIIGRNTKSGYTCGGLTSCFSGTRTCQPI